MKRNAFLWQCAGALFLLQLTAACGGPITTITPAAQPTGVQPIATKPATKGAPQSTPAAAAAPTTISSGPVPSSSGPVALQVLAPQDGAVVNTPQIQVSGTASSGAVVSVNDAVVVVGTDGTFTAAVALDAGPNFIEVIASNDSGDSKTIDLTVTYQQ